MSYRWFNGFANAGLFASNFFPEKKSPDRPVNQSGLVEILFYFLEFASELLLIHPQKLNFRGRDQAERNPRFPGSCRTSAPVSIIFVLIGQGIMDDKRQIAYVQASSSDVGSNQYVGSAVAEGAHHLVALFLHEVAVDGHGRYVLGQQLFGELDRVGFGAAENHAAIVGLRAEKLLDGVDLVLLVEDDKLMVDILITDAARAYLYALSVGRKVLVDDLFDAVGHGSREEPFALRLLSEFQYLVELGFESHAQHFVSLIKNHGLHI